MPPYLTERARRVFALAHDMADRRGNPVLTAAHLLLGLLEEGENLPVYILRTRGVELVGLARELEAELPAQGVPRVPSSTRTWTPDEQVFADQTWREARELDTVYCGCEHVLLALLRDRGDAPARVLARYGVEYDEMRSAVRWIYAAEPDATAPWRSAATA